MSYKLIFAAPLSLVSVSLYANAPAALGNSFIADSELFDIVRLLEQNALLALIGAIVLTGIAWISYVFKACAVLSNPQENTRIRPFMTLLVLVAGLSIFTSSCTMELQVRAADMRAVQAAENRACPMNHHIDYLANATYGYKPNNGYSHWHAPSYCRRCGQQIHRNR